MRRALDFLQKYFPGREEIKAPELCKVLGISRATFWRMRRRIGGPQGKDGTKGGFKFEEVVGLLHNWITHPDPVVNKSFFRHLPEELKERGDQNKFRTRGEAWGPPLFPEQAKGRK